MIEEITSPPFLDDTAQEMVTKLQAIANNINNNAGQVSYSNTTSQLQAETVQTAIDEVKGITDTISSSLTNLITVDTLFKGELSCKANSTIDVTFNMPKTGYNLIGCVGVNIGAGGGCTLVSYRVTDFTNSVITVRVRNNSSNTVTNFDIRVFGLYVLNLN